MAEPDSNVTNVPTPTLDSNVDDRERNNQTPAVAIATGNLDSASTTGIKKKKIVKRPVPSGKKGLRICPARPRHQQENVVKLADE